MKKNRSFYLTIMAFISLETFAQDKPLQIKGELLGLPPGSKSILTSETSSDPVTGKLFSPKFRMGYTDKSPEMIKIEAGQISGSVNVYSKIAYQDFMVFTENSEYAAIVPITHSKAASGGILNLGQIALSKTHKVCGQVALPEGKNFSEATSAHVYVTHVPDVLKPTEYSNFAILPIALDSSQFCILLPNGNYQFWILVSRAVEKKTEGLQQPEMVEEWRYKFIHDITVVKDKPIKLGKIDIGSKLQIMINQGFSNPKSPLDALFSKVNFDDMGEDSEKYVQDILLKKKIVVVYFFAYHCGPCFESLPKYMNLASDKVGVVAIHSDHLRSVNAGPQSWSEMKSMADKYRDSWGNVFESAKGKQSEYALIWQKNGTITKEIAITAYPTVLIFKDGRVVNSKAYEGTASGGYELLQDLILKN